MDWLRRRGQQFLAKIHILPSGTLPRKQQNADCLLLNLPVEVLELIYGYLPAASQLCLRQTCLATFYSLRNPDQLLRKELLEYLGIAFRNHPDFWVAARRPLLRRFQASDLPDLRTPPVCREPPWASTQIHRFERGALMVEHKHVQISIKYSQLEKKTRQQAKHLKILMTPYKTEFAPRLNIHPLEKVGEIGYFQWYPKVVSGRYLTFSQRSYTNNWIREPVILSELGCFGPCMHHYTDPARYQNFLQRQRRARENKNFSRYQRQWQVRRQPECSDSFFECIQGARDKTDTWFSRACPWCLTEYSISVTSEGALVLQTWRDLGGVDSPFNTVWEQHIDDGDLRGAAMERDPYEIRRRYGIVVEK